MSDVGKIINKVREIEPIPAIVSKAFALLSEEDYDIGEVEKVISLDPGITADLLKMANSPFYGFKSKIDTVKRAIVVLGSKNVLDIIITLHATTFIKKDAPGYSIEAKQMWLHALMVAFTCDAIARKLGLRSDVAYTAGLLHDVGKQVLGEFLKKKVENALQIVKDENVSFLEAERRVIGTDHAEVGAIIAENWNFPRELVNAIRFHHEPHKSEELSELTCLVHVADCMVLSSGIGTGTDGLAYEIDPKALEKLGISSIDPTFIDSAYLELAEKLKDIENELGE